MSITPGKTGSKTRCFEIKVSDAQKDVLEKAAMLQGRTLNEFMTTTLYNEALKVIRDHEVMELTGRDREIFLDALQNPTLPEGRIGEAIAHYKDLMD